MSRGYPRFLYSNPQNTKDKGPFIVHLLEPRLVFKVVTEHPGFEGATDLGFYDKSKNLGLIFLDEVPDFEEISSYEKTINDASLWLERQLTLGFIKL